MLQNKAISAVWGHMFVHIFASYVGVGVSKRIPQNWPRAGIPIAQTRLTIGHQNFLGGCLDIVDFCPPFRVERRRSSRIWEGWDAQGHGGLGVCLGAGG